MRIFMVTRQFSERVYPIVVISEGGLKGLGETDTSVTVGGVVSTMTFFHVASLPMEF